MATDPRWTREYKTNRAIRLAQPDGDLCWICGHHGALTCDHMVDVARWLAIHGTYDGVNDVSNLGPAHGTNGQFNNPCPTCGQMCNQTKGRSVQGRRSRQW